MSKVKLTESQLHNVIRKCINEALEEGRKTNNKPYFQKFYSNTDKNGKPLSQNRMAGKGDLLYNGDTPYADWDLKGNYNSMYGPHTDPEFLSVEEFNKLSPEEQHKYYRWMRDYLDKKTQKREDLKNQMRKHNERFYNQPYDAEKVFQDRKNQRMKKSEMLQYNDITAKDFEKMGRNEQEKYWDNYHRWNDYYNSPRAQRARHWNEIGDPNWDDIYDNLW